MPILVYNASWMTFNILLAILAVLLGYLFLQTKYKSLKLISGCLWLLFLPNTIYLFTDLMHIIHQWGLVPTSLRGVLILQFAFLEVVGFVTFILAFRPFEKIMEMFNLHARRKMIVIILFNFLIGFGMVLGRVERINSWEVLTQIEKVFAAIITVFTSLELLGLTLLFGLLCNFSYFLFRDPIFRSTKQLRKNFSK
jgi:uncharacterized membrane protein